MYLIIETKTEIEEIVLVLNFNFFLDRVNYLN